MNITGSCKYNIIFDWYSSLFSQIRQHADWRNSTPLCLAKTEEIQISHNLILFCKIFLSDDIITKAFKIFCINTIINLIFNNNSILINFKVVKIYI